MTEHGRKLLAMIGAVVHGLSNPPMLLPALEELGRRHLADGVEDRHYVTVAVALLWMLEKRLGAAFTPEMMDAWTAVYWVMADTMQDAARGEIALGRRLKPAAREAATRA
jgi:hemoglobin-like flavoprotein